MTDRYASCRNTALIRILQLDLSMTQNSKSSLEACEVSSYTGSTGMQILFRLRINLRIGLENLGRLWLVDRQAERKRAKEREREKLERIISKEQQL